MLKYWYTCTYFILKACQGQQFDDGSDMNVTDAKGIHPMEVDVNITVHSIPSEADFLIAYSVVPGNYPSSIYTCWRPR